MQVAAAAHRRLGVEAEGHEAIGQEPRQGRGQVDAHDHEDAPGAMDPAGRRRRPSRDRGGAQRFEVVEVALQAVPDVVGHACPLARRGFHDAVGREPRHEVVAQVGGEVGVALVAERLDGAHDGGGIDLEAARERARREEEGLVGVLQSGLQQAATRLGVSRSP